MTSQSGRVVYSTMLAAWTVVGSNPKPPPMFVDTFASMWINIYVYTVSRSCTRGESQEFIAHGWQSTQVRDPPWLWNPGETSPEVKNRGISGPTKRTYVLQKFLKKSWNVMNVKRKWRVCFLMLWNTVGNLRLHFFLSLFLAPKEGSQFSIASFLTVIVKCWSPHVSICTMRNFSSNFQKELSRRHWR